MPYIGNPPANKFVTPPEVQRFNGDNSTTDFTLANTIGADQDILVSVDGVIQDTTSYSVNDKTLTFTTAPSSGTNNIFVFTISPLVASVNHPATSPLNATSGTFTGDLTVDTSTLKVDSTNNRVGIGTTSPDSLLTVQSSGATTAKIDTSSSSSYAELLLEDGNAGYAIQTRSDNAQSTGTGSFILNDRDSASFPIIVKEGNATNTLVLDSSKVGLGIDPSTLPSFISHAMLIGNGGGLSITSSSSGDNRYIFFGTGTSSADVQLAAIKNTGSDLMFLRGSGTETARFDSSGRTLMATTQTNVISVDGRHGIVLNDKTNGFYAGVGQFSSNGNASMLLNRDSDDGSIQLFFQDAVEIGSITTSGDQVYYNSFSGSHWSRLSDNSKPTILKGTVIETIDEMCDWYQAQFEITEEEETRTVKQSIALPSDASVGDTLTVSFEGNDYTATIVKEADNKHTKCKISDTADSKRVYGVYAAWDNDDDTVNDMYVTAVGTHVVRINKDVTVSAGDLLSSNGDGTAKVQDDDIIRSKTIGKVLTNIKQETYDDGSYIVPCALYCG